MIGRLFKKIGEREDSLAAQSVILTGARTAGFVLTFGIPLVLVRVFGRAEFGIYKQLFLISGTLIPLLNLGLSASLFYFVPREKGDGQRYVLQALALLSMMGALAGLGLVFGAGEITQLMDAPGLSAYLALLALFTAVSIPAQLVESIPVVDRRPTLAAFMMAGSDLVRATAIIGVAYLVGTIEAVLWAAIACAMLRAVWLLLYLRLRRSADASKVYDGPLKSQLRYSLPFALAVFFQIGLARFHQYYVAANVSAAQFAVYAVGILSIPIIGTLVQSVVEVMLVRIAAAYKAGDLPEMRRVWRAAVERLSAILIPCWMVFQVFATDVIALLFGPEYLAAVPIFRVFLTVVLLLIIIDHGILRATADTAYLVKANVIGFLVSIAAVIGLAQYSVLLGAVCGYIIGMLAMRILGLVRVAQRLEVGSRRILPWGAVARTALAALASAAVSATVFALPGPLVRIAAGGMLFAAAYVSIAFRWEIVPRRELQALLRRFIPAYQPGS